MVTDAMSTRQLAERIAKLWKPRREPAHFRMTLREWLLRHQKEIVFGPCRWMGVPTYKNPLDAWILQEILFEVRPEIVIEIGSAEGGSTLFLAGLLELLGGGEVLSLDIDRSKFKASHARIVTLTGDSSSAEMQADVARRSAGKKTLVVHDADHRKDHVLSDLEAYAPLVTPSSYLVVEDGIVDQFEHGDGIGTRDAGPLEAIEEFLGRHPEFVVDPARERYLLTYNPRGYLKRIA